MGRRVVRTKGVCQGRARLFGTRIPVCTVVRLQGNGATMNTLWEHFPALTMEDLKVIYRYYKKHETEILEDIDEELKELA